VSDSRRLETLRLWAESNNGSSVSLNSLAIRAIRLLRGFPPCSAVPRLFRESVSQFRSFRTIYLSFSTMPAMYAFNLPFGELG
jgi:hypothetical protein